MTPYQELNLWLVVQSFESLWSAMYYITFSIFVSVTIKPISFCPTALVLTLHMT